MASQLEKIEKIANMLISASASSALCDKHYNMNNGREKMKSKECSCCFSVENDFSECEDHIPKVINIDCIEKHVYILTTPK